MKALTLWQPWASLIAWGEKHYETRSWKTDYRGPLAIHASHRLTEDQKYICSTLRVAKILSAHGIEDPIQLALGCIVCVADLVEVIATEAWFQRRSIPYKETAFGNYGYGRFAWKLENVHVLIEPIPVKGGQGLWEWPTSLKSLEFME